MGGIRLTSQYQAKDGIMSNQISEDEEIYDNTIFNFDNIKTHGPGNQGAGDTEKRAIQIERYSLSDICKGLF